MCRGALAGELLSLGGEAHGSVSSGLLEGFRAHQPISSMLGKFNVIIKFLQSFINEGGRVKVKGSSCELSLSPPTPGEGLNQ